MERYYTVLSMSMIWIGLWLEDNGRFGQNGENEETRIEAILELDMGELGNRLYLKGLG